MVVLYRWHRCVLIVTYTASLIYCFLVYDVRPRSNGTLKRGGAAIVHVFIQHPFAATWRLVVFPNLPRTGSRPRSIKSSLLVVSLFLELWPLGLGLLGAARRYLGQNIANTSAKRQPKQHRRIANTSPQHRQPIANTYRIHRQNNAEASPGHHRKITNTSPSHHQKIADTLPKHRQRPSHQLYTSPTHHGHINNT